MVLQACPTPMLFLQTMILVNQSVLNRFEVLSQKFSEINDKDQRDPEVIIANFIQRRL